MNETREGWPARWRLWGPVVVWMAAIFAASSIPNPPPPPAGLTDKTEHIIVYAILGGFALRAFAGGRWMGVTAAAVASATVLAGAYGATDEWHQRFVPGRSPEVVDVMADIAGAALAAVALWAWKKLNTEE